MTTRRRLAHDRRRYNALRRISQRMVRAIRRDLGIAARAQFAPYLEAREDGTHAVKARGWCRCVCGRKHQTVRLS